MEKRIDTETIEVAVRMILAAVGDDPDREGLIDTPRRVANMYKEVFEGMLYTNEEIAQMNDKCFDCDDREGDYHDLVVVKDIPIFSYCEHHLALMYNMKVHVAYIPNGKVIGLSKISRIADMVSKRLQLQEKIGKDIADCISMVVKTPDVAVIVTGEHACVSARGVKKPGAVTTSSTLRGLFVQNPALRQELYSILN